MARDRLAALQAVVKEEEELKEGKKEGQVEDGEVEACPDEENRSSKVSTAPLTEPVPTNTPSCQTRA